VHEQLGAPGLLERCAESVDELVGQLADEPDRVGQQVRPASQAQGPDRRIEGVEQAVAHTDIRAGEHVQERRLAGVGVAHERNRRQRCALALGTLHGARALDVLQTAAQGRDPVTRQAAVGLDLGLPWAPRADATAEALEVAPQPAHAGEVVLELGELDLELALSAMGVGSEDVEDDCGAVDDRHPEGLFEVALLARGKLVVTSHEIRVGAVQLGLDLLELARPEIGVGVWLLAALDELADRGHA
jgi:hypothetical protein